MSEKLRLPLTETVYQSCKSQFLAKISFVIDETFRVPLGLDEEDNSETRIKKFIDSCCKISYGLEVSSSDLFEKYVQWCNSNGINPEIHDNFSKQLNKMIKNKIIKGIIHKRKTNRAYWTGIGIVQ